MLWKTVPGFSIYEVSENGTIRRSLTVISARVGKQAPRLPPGTILKPCFKDKKDAYLCLRLLPDDGSRSKVMKVHVVVALAFHGPKPYPEACALHKNDDRYHNHYKNIYWGTKRQNSIDRSVNGRHGRAKLSRDSVLWIRELYHGDRRTYAELADMFAMDQSSIAQIIKRKTYNWV
jgi:hypothetical protein